MRRIKSAKLNNGEINIELNNKLSFNTHKTNIEDISLSAFILYMTAKISNETEYDDLNQMYKFNVNNDNIHFNKINTGDYINIDWGKERSIIKMGYHISYQLIILIHIILNLTLWVHIVLKKLL